MRGNNIKDYSGLNLKSDKSNKNIILKMLDELNNGSDYEKYINVDGVLRYLAVSTVLSNLDSYQGNFKHNYYLYEENGVFSIIPWDLNMSFAGFGMGANNSQAVEMLIDEPTMGKVSEWPLIDKLLQREEYKQKYHDYINEIVSGYLSPERFEKRVQELSEFIAPYVKKDPTKFYTFEEHQKSLREDVENTVGLTSFVTARVNNVKKQLDGTLPSYKNGEGLTVSRGFPGNRDAGGRPAMAIADNADGNNQMAPNGAPPEGWMPPMGSDGQFPPPNMRGGMGEQVNENHAKEAISTAVALILLILSAVFIARYKNNRI